MSLIIFLSMWLSKTTKLVFFPVFRYHLMLKSFTRLADTKARVGVHHTFPRQNSCRCARDGSKPAGYWVVNCDQSRTQTVPQPGPPQASKNCKHLHIISQKEAQQKCLAGSSQDQYFKLQILYATSSLFHGYIMQTFNTNSSTLSLKLNRHVILAIDSYYVSLAQNYVGGRS